MRRYFKKMCLLSVGLFLLTATAIANESVITKENGDYIEKISQDFVVEAGGSVYLNTSFGSVVVKSWDKEEVLLSVNKVTDASSESTAKEVFEKFTVSAQKKENDIHIKVQDSGSSELFDVIFQLNVPRKFNLDLETDDGKIEIGDLEGNVEAETKKGSIRVGDVTGKLEAITAGGLIAIGRIGGAINADTGGGAVRIKEGGADINAKTGGGGITIGLSNGIVQVKTGGGAITVEQSNGDVHAKTGGGAITIGLANGDVYVKTGGGAIVIGPVKGKVEAETGGGKIEIGGSGGPVTASTGGGDVTIHLSEDFPATFDVELSVDKKRRRKRYKITSDFPLDIKKDKDWLGGIKHTATGKINGGGNLIRLSTKNSNIYIKKLE
jgi:hypothetical protein